MIPRADIIEWRSSGFSWKTDAMVEQDLIISRMLVELFSDPMLCECLVFRGGTALHKLFFNRPLRYSEDIDLVQREPGPIGPVFDKAREVLSSWLGENPRRKQGPGVVSLIYRLDSEDSPPQPLRVKIEINTLEHFYVLPLETRMFSVSSRWFSGEAEVPVYVLDELLATKLRALYQRRKGRDLFDLAAALRSLTVDPVRIIRVFDGYMEAEGHRISSQQFRHNLIEKQQHPAFAQDCPPLLRPGIDFDLQADCELINKLLLSRLPNPKSRDRQSEIP